MSRRGEILKEMGLTPVWRLRTGTSPEVSSIKEETSIKEEGRDAEILRLDWPELKARVAGCTDCKLRAGCSQTVFGVGDEKAEWMLVGEAPGAEEDRIGEPFVGQAGKLLDNMLAAVA